MALLKKSSFYESNFHTAPTSLTSTAPVDEGCVPVERTPAERYTRVYTPGYIIYDHLLSLKAEVSLR